MLIEFITHPQFNFLTAFAAVLNVPVVNNELQIPSSLGEGFVRRIDLNDDFRLLIHRYRLKQELVLKRIGSTEPASFISVMFYNNDEPVSMVADDEEQRSFSRYNDMAIQIASNNLDSVVTFQANSEIYYTVLGISISRLKTLLELRQPGKLINAIVNPKESFLFYESMGTETQMPLKELSEPQAANGLAAFYYRLKAETLLYAVFTKLQNRQSTGHSPVNKADAEKLAMIRKAILGDLSQPPSLPDLAELGGLSETKMKDLFRQVFGDSIYNYYQTARMEEAAYLLRYKRYSVSEAGYALGFSNLSHFTRLFERHHQQKPKKYASGG
ncbi:helix-turn-helix domain-containing protein [Mucilaginibacter ginsenosidivorax]|uniref:Helix-turn-helix transcriptional regulator n=1 Tax=Mucilaginibacter ginsenosidivorax TaxID=862126 RepID=A0A5B8VTT0_9SPHI|nr:AraC family transcriptional regulator [Mucilaginibacter ginsenosidivorax]QEC74653.1 helix-turn-helix transcriptional regulator [Mucilaginibacter ginsenosidivorax]